MLFVGNSQEYFANYAARPPTESVSARQYCDKELDPLITCKCSFCRGRERDTLNLELNVLTSGVNNCSTKRWQCYALLEDKS